MSTRKSVIPEFMKNNPDDTFEFLFPLKIALDEDKYGNSHYEVVVKNITIDSFPSNITTQEIQVALVQLSNLATELEVLSNTEQKD